MDFQLAFDKMQAEDRLYNDYFKERVDGTKRIGPPLEEDWLAVDRLLNFLVIFYNSTLVLSATNSPRSHKCYNEMVTIERNLISLSLDADDDLRKKVDSMLSKLGKYWDPFGFETEMNRMLIVASVFDPRNKMKFAKLCFEKLYGLFKEYNVWFGGSVNRSNTASSNGTSSQAQASGSATQTDTGAEDLGRTRNRRLNLVGRARYERMDVVYKELVQESGFQEVTTELELYLTENVENPHIFAGSEYDVLSWWKVNNQNFPVLSQVAKDILAMQVSSVASESAFSISGRILDPFRSCLPHYTIEVLMCTEQWLKSEIRMDSRGTITIEQLLDEIEDQDDLQREFGEKNLHE
ncbi:zinc finger BED domain-containing protein RICESLEEPER 2-like [Eutrema salsugineum]|uniref:zinc finger BED domain-containing protein RICESLEEPER 2-like n=1 Tax=Eutrema salsugineum TaxID=72664 RepID=UPI000CED5E4E|nr:zinc finger BED domain-containing protein RICESLEEPER 2-like [Eutrema salsugineum]